MNFIKEYNTKQYVIYLIRWIISAFVMMPFMYIFQILGLPLTVNLILGQIIGSIIFFGIDKKIFHHHDKDTTEKELSKVL